MGKLTLGSSTWIPWSFSSLSMQSVFIKWVFCLWKWTGLWTLFVMLFLIKGCILNLWRRLIFVFRSLSDEGSPIGEIFLEFDGLFFEIDVEDRLVKRCNRLSSFIVKKEIKREGEIIFNLVIDIEGRFNEFRVSHVMFNLIKRLKIIKCK